MTISLSRFGDLVREVLIGVIGPSGKYIPGDHVQLLKGGPLMIVQWTRYCRRTRSLLINCIWFDSEVKTNRVETFSEKELKAFDWYHQ